jgi:acyl-homoserine lactone acylase PvdQ
VVTGNNDPGGMTLDNSLFNDKWYIGGPWANGYRAGTIARALKKQADATNASVAGMAEVQANHESRLGQEWVPFLVEAIDTAKNLKKLDGPLAAHEQRLVDLYDSITPTVRDDAVARLAAWQGKGSPASSGVETFYHTVASGEVDNAIATTIFNSFFGRFLNLAVEDEGVDLWEPWGADARTRTLYWIAKGRGPNNPEDQASWNPATQESAFWDILQTEPVETSREIALLALKQGLDESVAWWKTADMTKWIWGMRHGVKFDSLLAEFLDSGIDLSAITEAFAINPDRFPVAAGLTKDDPRSKLTGFPRAGDAFAVDAAGGINNSGYGSGPVFRMVFRMGKDKVDGVNVLPGGQSGLPDSAFFDDQAKLWLGNQTMPVRVTVADVVAGAVKREVLRPKK